MNDKEQIQALSNDIDNLIDRYRAEFDMTYAAVVGILTMKAQMLCNESQEEE